MQSENHQRFISSYPRKRMSISSIVASYHQEPMEPKALHIRSPPISPESPSPRHIDEDILTAEERRQRNKAASAKYRQKKNQQQNEMKRMISQLSEQHILLERQLQELRAENERLKMTLDKLRGKMEARKVLKKWIKRQSEGLSYNLLDQGDGLE